jgi:hypothetical protein
LFPIGKRAIIWNSDFEEAAFVPSLSKGQLTEVETRVFRQTHGLCRENEPRSRTSSFSSLKGDKMNGKTKQFRIVLLLASLLAVGLIVLNGCKGKEAESEPNEPNAVAAAAIQ